MNNIRNKKRLHRARRVRVKITGTAVRPRMSVFRSLRSLRVQLIDDVRQVTLMSADLTEITGAKNTIEGAEKLGQLIAKKAIEKNISNVVFDRSGYKYHGKVRSLADGARAAGLQF